MQAKSERNKGTGTKLNKVKNKVEVSTHLEKTALAYRSLPHLQKNLSRANVSRANVSRLDVSRPDTSIMLGTLA
jgi:hypothetical protein